MTEEKHLSPGDARQTEVAPPMEHRASPKVLPVEDSMKSDTPYFPICFS